MNNLQNITDTRLVRPIHPGEVIANCFTKPRAKPSQITAQQLGRSIPELRKRLISA